MHIGRPGREPQGIRCRHARVARRSLIGGHVDLRETLRLRDGKLRPDAGVEVIEGAVSGGEIHRHGRELATRAAL
jgi:hypothetical protein